ncbi:MAG: 30S ribosomal protein S4 [Candidatus Pacearchaeota archaeon]
MRRFKNTYLSPKKRWDKARIEEEKQLMKEYGLKNKREIYKVYAIIKKIRKIAKKLVIASEEEKREFIKKLSRYGFVNENATLDDVLALDKRKILDRRLQTIVFKKGLANTIKQARQFIVHGHISINGKTVNVPSYLVKLDEENLISLNDKLNKILKQK